VPIDGPGGREDLDPGEILVPFHWAGIWLTRRSVMAGLGVADGVRLKLGGAWLGQGGEQVREK
jgi:hypothetical protein